MFRKLLGTFALVLFAGCIALLPRLVYGNTGTPPSLSISEAAPASPDPVAVGDKTGPFVTVSFAVNVITGNEQNESGPVNVKNQQYTISGGGGMIVSAGAAGLTTSTIPTGGTGSVIITGGQTPTSFTISATLFFPQTAAGTDTVSCSGFLTLSDGTQVDSSPNGSAPVTAVAVDSITLKDDPTAVQIGQKMTESDFTITTTPTGYGNNSIVQFSPSSFPVVVGDNWVYATCGVSQAQYDLTAAQLSGSWTGYSSAAPAPTDSAAYTVKSDGEAGSYSVTGQFVTGGDTSGQLTSGNPHDGTVDITATVSDSPGQVVAANLKANAHAVVVAAVAGQGAILAAGIPLIFNTQAPTLAPNANQLQLSTAAINPIGWSAGASTSTALINTSGVGVYFAPGGANLFEVWANNPSATVTVNVPVPSQVTFNGGAPQNMLWDASTLNASYPAFTTEDQEPPAGALPANFRNAITTGTVFGHTLMESGDAYGVLSGPNGWQDGPAAHWKIEW